MKPKVSGEVVSLLLWDRSGVCPSLRTGGCIAQVVLSWELCGRAGQLRSPEQHQQQGQEEKEEPFHHVR